MPITSVMKPGVSRNAPPRITIAPSKTSRVGYPALGQRLVEAPPRGPALGAQQRGAEEAVEDQQRDRRQHADRLADLDDHVELGDRQDDEDQDQEQGHGESLDQPAAPPRYHDPMATEDTATVTQDDVYEALEEVIDPELGLDFVSLGLVYDVEIEDADVYVTFTLTTPGCPIGPQVSEQIKEFVGELEGVDEVHPKMVFDPPWSPDMMSEDAKFALGY